MYVNESECEHSEVKKQKAFQSFWYGLLIIGNDVIEW